MERARLITATIIWLHSDNNSIALSCKYEINTRTNSLRGRIQSGIGLGGGGGGGGAILSSGDVEVGHVWVLTDLPQEILSEGISCSFNLLTPKNTSVSVTRNTRTSVSFSLLMINILRTPPSGVWGWWGVYQIPETPLGPLQGAVLLTR